MYTRKILYINFLCTYSVATMRLLTLTPMMERAGLWKTTLQPSNDMAESPRMFQWMCVLWMLQVLLSSTQFTLS